MGHWASRVQCLHTQGPVVRGGGGGGGLPVYENPKDPQGGASSLDLKSFPAGAPEQPAQTQALPYPPCWGGPEGRSTESSE